MFRLSRTDTQYDGYVYQCDRCHADGQSVALINHGPGCSVGEPDAVSLPVSESSTRQLTALLRETEWLYQRHQTAEDMMDEIRDIDGVRWVDNQSTSRIAVGLGAVSTRGEFHRDDQRGLVMKLDPAVRWNDDYTPVNSNLDELMTWETAKRTETTQLFAEIFAAAQDGAWLVMEECLPISHSVREKMQTRDVLFDDDRQYTSPFRAELRDNGWIDPDYKNTNMGLTDDGRTVLLDYGTGPRRKPPES